MDNETKNTHGGEEVEEQKKSNMEDVAAEAVNITQGGAQSITADNLSIRQGGVVQARTEHLEMMGGGIVLAQTQTADLTAAQAGAIISEGDVTMELSGSQLLLARGDVTMDQSGAVTMIARNVRAENSGTVFLLANEVEGTVNAAFGPRESVIFGAVAGAVAGLVMLLAKLSRRE